jgi:hypothetical protein
MGFCNHTLYKAGWYDLDHVEGDTLESEALHFDMHCPWVPGIERYWYL